MAAVKIYRETALPGTLQANSVYLIAPAGSPNYVEMYVTGTSASTVTSEKCDVPNDRERPSSWKPIRASSGPPIADAGQTRRLYWLDPVP